MTSNYPLDSYLEELHIENPNLRSIEMRLELSRHFICSSNVWLTFLHTSKQTSAHEGGFNGLSLLVTLQLSQKLSGPSLEIQVLVSAHRNQFMFLYHTQHRHQEEFGLPKDLDLFRILAGLWYFISGMKYVWRGNYSDSRIIPWIPGMIAILFIYVTLPLDLMTS